MPNPENLIGKGFDARPENINRAGRIDGARNRSTLLRAVADAIIERPSLDGKTTAPVTAEMAVAIALFQKAMTGDVAAVKELQDTLYGKIADKQELTGADGGPIATQAITEPDEAIIQRYLAQKNKPDES